MAVTGVYARLSSGLPRARMKFFGRGIQPPSHQLGGSGSAVSSSAGSGAKMAFLHLRFSWGYGPSTFPLRVCVRHRSVKLEANIQIQRVTALCKNWSTLSLPSSVTQLAKLGVIFRFLRHLSFFVWPLASVGLMLWTNYCAIYACALLKELLAVNASAFHHPSP